MYGMMLSEESRDALSSSWADKSTKGKIFVKYKELYEKNKDVVGGYFAWRAGNSNKILWKDAQYLYDLYSSKPTCGIKRLCTLCSSRYTSSQLSTITRLFNSGWIPSQDTNYMKWLKEQ